MNVEFYFPIKIQKTFTEFGQEALPQVFGTLDLPTGKFFWGYASVDAVDEDGDRIELKALKRAAETLTTAPYNKIFLGHEYRDIAAGKILKAVTDSNGLLILAQLNEDHQRAEEIWKSILEGYLDGFSIGGSFLDVQPVFDKELGRMINVVREMIIREVTLTSIPANPFSMLAGAFQKARKQLNTDGKPFAGYESFDACVAANTGKVEDPKAYCATIMNRAEGKSKSEKFIYNGEYNKSMDSKTLQEKLSKGEKLSDDELKFLNQLIEKDASEDSNSDADANAGDSDAGDSDADADKDADKDADADKDDAGDADVDADKDKDDAETQKSLNSLMVKKIQDMEKQIASLTKSVGQRKSVKSGAKKYTSPEGDEQKSATPFLDWVKRR